MKNKSPYLVNSHRLSDVLAAIQVTGSQRWDSREMNDWKTNLGDAPQSAETWEEVFDAHPEFFGSRPRKKDERGYTVYFLRLRRAYERTFDPKLLRELTAIEIEELIAAGTYDSVADARKLTRKPLTASQIEALMKTAVELQVRAAALADRARWWILLAPAFFGFVGAISGSLFNGHTAASTKNDPPSQPDLTSPSHVQNAPSPMPAGTPKLPPTPLSQPPAK